jgi:hypothetical protein
MSTPMEWHQVHYAEQPENDRWLLTVSAGKLSHRKEYTRAQIANAVKEWQLQVSEELKIPRSKYHNNWVPPERQI